MIPVYEPSLGKEELSIVQEVMESGWISSKGKYIPEFEEAFAKYCNVNYGVACSNGTTALHLALTALDIKKGDEVIVPTLTFVSTANVILFTGAKPVFVESDPNYWCINPDEIEKKITKHTKAIIPVHLYGHPCDMKAIMDVAKENNLFVIEDAAEAHGAEYKGKKVGSLGDINCFSFYGNKIITTGEGGMCVTPNQEHAEKMRILRDHGMDPKRRYWHEILGFNYRMTNIQAAIGVVQLKKLDKLITKKRRIAKWYREELKELEKKDLINLHPEMDWAKNVYWMYSILIQESFSLGRDELIKELYRDSIETRPFFNPIHKFPYFRVNEKFPIAEKLSEKGINLPSSANLSKEEVITITRSLSNY